MSPTKRSRARDQRSSVPSSTAVGPLGEVVQRDQVQQELEQHLWEAADILRGPIGSGDYKHHLFALLLFKRLCDVREEETSAHSVDGHTSVARSSKDHLIQIPEGYWWVDIRRLSVDIGTALNGSLRAIEDKNPRLKGVFQNVDFANKERFPDLLLEQLLWHFDRRRLSLADVDFRRLGDACEYMIERFADEARLKHGERHTPKAVARLLVALTRPDEGMSIYDPVCGTAGLLLETARHLERAGKDPTKLEVFGQEANPSTWAMCQMSLVLHGMEGASVVVGDTLRNPQLLNRSTSIFNSKPTLRRFDRMLANPPFSLKDWGYELWNQGDPFGRDQYGCPPRGFGDFAFVLHMLASLNDGGRMAVIVPYGVLFRSGEEARIREALIRDDLLEAVVALGRDLFVGTSVPVAVLIFQRNKPPERQGRVLIVNGEDQEVTGHKQKILTSKIAEDISQAVERFTDVPSLCRVLTLAQLEESEFDLTAARYVQRANSLAEGNYGAGSSGDKHELPEAKARLQAFVSARDLAEARIERTSAVPLDNDAKLALVDEAVHATQHALAQARRIKSLRVHEIFTGGLTGASHRRTEVENIPSHWPLVSLEEFLQPGDGLLNGANKHKSDQGEAVLWIGQRAITIDGRVAFDEARPVRLQIDISRFALRADDVLIKRVNGSRCGEAGLVEEIPNVPVVFNPGMLRLRVDPRRMRPLLLLHWLHHDPVRRYLMSKARASVKDSINQQILRALPCPRIGNERECQSITTELRDLDDAVAEEVRHLSRLVKARADLSVAHVKSVAEGVHRGSASSDS